MTIAEHAEQSIEDVLAGRVTLPDGLLEVGGFCSLPIRQLFHRLAQPPLTAYLEVGVLHGATMCCALTGQLDRAFGIDNFTQFSGHEAETRANLERFRRPGTNVRLQAGSAFTFQPDGAPYDWYYYDADHTEPATAAAMHYYAPSLAERSLLMVDDYDDPGVQAGVARGLREGGLTVEWERYLRSGRPANFEGWWCGLYLAVVRRA